MTTEDATTFLGNMVLEFELSMSEVIECEPPPPKENVKRLRVGKGQIDTSLEKRRGSFEDSTGPATQATTRRKRSCRYPYVCSDEEKATDEEDEDAIDGRDKEQSEDELGIGNLERMFKNVQLSQLSVHVRRSKCMQFVQNWPFATDVEVAAKDPSGTILKMADNIVMNGILLSSLSTHLNKMRLDMRVSKVAKEDAEEKLEKMDEKLAAEKTTSHRLREERDALRKQVALLQQKENSLTAELQNEQRQVEDYKNLGRMTLKLSSEVAKAALGAVKEKHQANGSLKEVQATFVREFNKILIERNQIPAASSQPEAEQPPL